MAPAGKPAQFPRLLDELLQSSLIASEDWEEVALSTRGSIARCVEPDLLLFLLVQYGLLTDYQARMAADGRSAELILDNYRILDRLGEGATGVVYKAEHVHLRQLVAIKVLSVTQGQVDHVLKGYFSAMRILARMNHRQMVGPVDAGEIGSPHSSTPVIHYLAYEFIGGQDLEQSVRQLGPMRADAACDLANRVAGALAEAHRHELVHHGLKPSNVMVTGDGQVKLLDFGLAAHFRHRLAAATDRVFPGDFLAPEETSDPARADHRADIYGLGAILLWCLTGEAPVRFGGTLNHGVVQRLARNLGLPGVRRHLVPSELDAVLARLLASNPADRYQTCPEAIRALTPFLANDKPQAPWPEPHLLPRPIPEPLVAGESTRCHRVLIVDDEADIRQLCRCVLERHAIRCDEAVDGPDALRQVSAVTHDLVLLDMAMPGMTGQDVCKQLRANPAIPNLKIILFSGHLTSDDLATLLSAGADDYVTKPFSVVQLLARIKAALRLKEAQDRADLFSTHLRGVNRELEQNLSARDRDLVEAHKALVLALAKLVECRDTETGTHLKRLQSYSRCLAEEAARFPAFESAIDAEFVRWLEWSAPLHDIGKAGIPDRILQKPGPLTAEERRVMQRHTVLGAETLKEVARQHGSGMAFLHLAVDVARHHHERYDGTGYPDQLVGNAIPLAARLLAIADVYDALRSRRVYKPSLSHADALRLMLEESPGQFDPALLQAFQRCADAFDRIFTEWAD